MDSRHQKLNKLRSKQECEQRKVEDLSGSVRFGCKLGAIVGAITTIGGGMMATAIENAARKKAYVQTIQPEINQKVAEIKAILQERYPQLDTSNWDSSNMVEGLRKAYNDCYTTISGGNVFKSETIKIIPGWDRYFVDYRNGNLGWVNEGIESITSGYDHASILDSIRDMLPLGVGALALTLAIVAVPSLIHKAKADSLNRQIAKLEANQNEK